MTPTAVTDSFFPAPQKIGGVELRMFSLAQYMFLQFMRSPIVTDARACGEIDLARALLVMSRPIAETWKLWFALPEAAEFPVTPPYPADEETPVPSHAFEAQAWETADLVGMKDLRELGETLKRRIDAEFATAVPMRMPEGKGSERPKGQADTPRVSAGNSH